MSPGSKHKVPQQVPSFLELLRDDAQRNGEEVLCLILSSCTCEIEEEYTYDSWDNGMWGHALHLLVPREVFARFSVDDIPSYEKMIDERMNKLIRTRNEYVDHVTIQVSAAVGPAPTPPSRAADTDLWGGEDLLRLFVSHVAAHKADAHALKEACISLGISCFVAHDDISPTAEWEKEILRALRSMDALVAWLTPQFHGSMWTDQEVGVAIGRRVPVIPVRRGLDPYGFIGKYQGITCQGLSMDVVAQSIMKLLLNRFDTTSPTMKRALIERFARADSYQHARDLIPHLTSLDDVSLELIETVESACNENSQISENHDLWKVKQLIEGWRNELSNGS